MYGVLDCTASWYGPTGCTAPLYGLGAVPVVMVADGTEVSGSGLEEEAGKAREGCRRSASNRPGSELAPRPEVTRAEPEEAAAAAVAKTWTVTDWLDQRLIGRGHGGANLDGRDGTCDCNGHLFVSSTHATAGACTSSL